MDWGSWLQDAGTKVLDANISSRTAAPATVSGTGTGQLVADGQIQPVAATGGAVAPMGVPWWAWGIGAAVVVGLGFLALRK